MKENKYADLYFQDSVDKQILMEVVGTGITIDNSMIEQGSFSLTETLCSESELTFGTCEPNHFTVTVHDMPRSIKGETVVIREHLDGHTDAPLTYGVYKVYSDVPTSDRTKREITAYDAMYDIINVDVKSWYAGLSFPMTLRQFRDSFFAHFGITQKETTLVNDGMTVNKTLVATQTDPDSAITEEPAISGKTIVTAICEINGVFGNMNRDGEFEYVELKEIITPLYPSNDLYPSDDLFPRDPNSVSLTGHYITFDYEDFQTKQITQLEIRPSDDSAGATVGTGGNNYVISGNFLVSDKTGTELEDIAANTLSIIRKASYTPLKSSEVVGNPCIELGDPIRFNTTREIIESYVLQRTLTGIQNKRDSIVSPGTETYKQNPNSIRDQIAGVQRRTNKLERTADHTLSELADLDANTTSRFEQTSEQIQTEVSNRQSADSDLSSRITQTADSITTEVANRQSADNEMSSRISQTANEIASEVAARQNADTEMSAKISQTAQAIEAEVAARGSADNEMATKISQAAHSIALVASGGDNSVGITIRLYDENGNLIDTESENANIKIVGFVAFSDLEGSGTTSINGANIQTGTISADKLIAGALTAGRVETSDGSIIIDTGAFHVASGTIYVGVSNATEIGTSYIKSGNISASNQLYSSGTIYSAGDIKCDGTIRGSLSGTASSASYASSAGSARQADRADYASSSGYADYADTADKCGNETSNSHTANCYITSALTIYKVPSGSARRFKTDIYTVVDPRLDPHRLYDIDVVQFKYKPSFYNLPEGTEMPTVIGMLADDIDLIYPCACEYDEETGEVINWLERYMIPPMLALIQEQHKDIELLKQENLALQNRVSILEQRMEEMWNVINNKINQS
ncbi:MAG: hypothetical protein MSA09_11850 [Lachnospiraceae bacterium]|nr:hypothetical protein [Lachnospiraceae bacterium]